MSNERPALDAAQDSGDGGTGAEQTAQSTPAIDIKLLNRGGHRELVTRALVDRVVISTPIPNATKIGPNGAAFYLPVEKVFLVNPATAQVDARLVWCYRRNLAELARILARAGLRDQEVKAARVLEATPRVPRALPRRRSSCPRHALQIERHEAQLDGPTPSSSRAWTATFRTSTAYWRFATRWGRQHR